MSLNTIHDRLSQLQDILYSCFFGKARKNKKDVMQHRALHLDSLESRELLAVGVTTPYDIPVSQLDYRSVLVDLNGKILAQPAIIAGNSQSTGGSNNGDVVMTWTVEEPVWIRDWSGTVQSNPNYGQPIPLATGGEYGITGDYQPYRNAQTGEIIWESNIYARYLTNEVQRITLPASFNDMVAGGSRYNNFTLQYGTTIQKLNFTTSNAPEYAAWDTGYTNNVPIKSTAAMSFSFPANGLNVAPVTGYFTYNETLGADVNAKLLQIAIRGMGNYTSDVIVTATSAREFHIEFPNAYWKENIAPEIVINSAPLTGFLAAATISTIQRPVVVGNVTGDMRTVEQAIGTGTPANTPANLPCILMDQNNALQTAANMKYALMYAMSYTDFFAPINSTLWYGGALELPFYAEFGSTNPADVASVEVVPVGKPGDPEYGLVFDITFTNDFGKLNIPELLVISAVDKLGQQHVDRTEVTLNNLDLYGRASYIEDGAPAPVVTIKQNSDVFRVNPLEPINPATPYLDALRQANPVVAVDADGDFVIAWDVVSGNYLKPISLYNSYDRGNVFVRTFSPQEYLSDLEQSAVRQQATSVEDIFLSVENKAVQGVRPTSKEIQVNKETNGIQSTPTVACDRYGNFVVAWNSVSGQTFSYYEGVKARWFDRDGRDTTTDVQVSQEITHPTYAPRAAMSEDGVTYIAWTYALFSYEMWVAGGNLVSSIWIPTGDLYKNVYNPGSTLPTFVESIPRAFDPSFAFDSSGRYVFSYSLYDNYLDYDFLNNPDAYPTAPRLERTVVTQMYAPVYGAAANGQYDVIGENKVGAENRIAYEETRTERWYWTNAQLGTSVAIDADGDYVVSYPGSGNDVDLPLDGILRTPVPTVLRELRRDGDPADFTRLPRILDPTRWRLYVNEDVLVRDKNGNPTRNADLEDYLRYPLGVSVGSTWDADIDAMIRDYLTIAQIDGATYGQLARISAYLETHLGLLRGSSNDILFTLFDADPNFFSDAYSGTNLIANAVRAGNSETYGLALNKQNSRAFISLPGPESYLGAAHVNGPDGPGTGPGTVPHYWNMQNTSFTLDAHVYAEGGIGALVPQAIKLSWEGAWDDAKGVTVGRWTLEYDPTKMSIRKISAAEAALREGTLWDFGEPSDWRAMYEGNSTINDLVSALGSGDFRALALFEVTFLDSMNDLDVQLFVTKGTTASITFLDPYPEYKAEVNGDTITYTALEAEKMEMSLTWVATVHEQYGSSGVSQVSVGSVMSKKGDFAITYAQEMAYQESHAQTLSGAGAGERYLFPEVQKLGLTSVHLFFRNFTENSDSAGAYVTDFYAGDGNYIRDGQTVDTDRLNTATSPITGEMVGQIVVSFDEELRTMDMDKVHAVDNPANWELYRDGELLKDAILSIEFGLNRSREYEIGGALSHGKNNYEAVITFKEPFANVGQYKLVPKNSIYDIAGNGINKNGVFDYQPQNVTPGGLSPVEQRLWLYRNNIITFNVMGTAFTPDGDVQDVTQSGTFRNDKEEISPKGTASDAEGNYVIAWTTGTQILVQKYHANGQKVGGSVVVDTLTATEINQGWLVSQASVAMDGDGDFVVTWTKGKWDSSRDVPLPSDFSNIYYSYFTERDGAIVPSTLNGETVFQVNSYNWGVQQHPAVAMDTDGDFVIVWESYGQETTTAQDYTDTESWGVYGQRFSPFSSVENNLLGGRNAVQEITIVNGNEGATFTLSFTPLDPWGTPTGGPYVSLPISVRLNAFQMETAIKTELTKIFKAAGLVKGNEDVVEVNAVSLGPMETSPLFPATGGLSEFQAKLRIEYIGELASLAITWNSNTGVGLGLVELKPDYSSLTHRGADVRLFDAVYGDSGEFRANVTTYLDQRHPSVAMSMTGDVVVTWTGTTKNLFTQEETTDIYARTFISNHFIRASESTYDPDDAIYGNVTPGPGVGQSEANVVVDSDKLTAGLVSSTKYTGVVQIAAGDVLGTGSLLTSRYHILTAAHVVTNDDGTMTDPGSIVVTFDTATGPVYIPVVDVIVHPMYRGIDSFAQTVDLAVLVLGTYAPQDAESYDLYRGTDELGKDMSFVGYGMGGDGPEGEYLPYGIKREGYNTYEITGATFNPTYNPNLLLYDFDGTAEYTRMNGMPYTFTFDTFGELYGLNNTGLGVGREATSAHGDSGGPTFIDGKIAGVVSGGVEYRSNRLPVDLTDYVGNNTSFGAISWDVRVSSYVDWIDTVMTGGSGEFMVNEHFFTAGNDGTFEVPGGEWSFLSTFPEGNQKWSDVAMDALGNFVVTWTSEGTWSSYTIADIEGGQSRYIETSLVCARRFVNEPTATPYGGQFFVSSILDTDGDFTIRETVLGTGVYEVSRRSFATDEGEYNPFEQSHSKVAINPRGDFVIAWEEQQGQYMPGGELESTTDVYLRYYLNTLDYSRYMTKDENGQVLPEHGIVLGADNRPVDLSKDTIRLYEDGRYENSLNGYKSGYSGFLFRTEGGAMNQDYNVTEEYGRPGIYFKSPNVAMNSNGKTIIAWQEETETGPNGTISYIRGDRVPNSNVSSPFVTDVIAYAPGTKPGENATVQQILDQSEIYFGPSYIIVTLSEDVYHANVNNLASILNASNWSLWKDGMKLPSNAILSINFGKTPQNTPSFTLRNAAADLIGYETNKYEIVLQLDGNPYDRTKTEALKAGEYRLVLSATVTDVDKVGGLTPLVNRLDGAYYGRPQSDFNMRFTIGEEAGALVLDNDPTRPTDPKPSVGKETDTPAINDLLLHDSPCIAVRQDGYYIIAAMEYYMGVDGLPISRIVVKHFDEYGKAIGQHNVSAGVDINDYETYSELFSQSEPSISIDKYGNYVVTWVVAGRGTSGGTVYARSFDRYGNPLTSYDVQIPVTFGSYHTTPKVSLGNDGNYTIAWISNNTGGSGLAIYARTFSLYGQAQTDVQTIATIPLLTQNGVELATDGEGRFVATWYAYDTSNNTTNIFARTFSVIPKKVGAYSYSYQFGTAFRVNTYVLGTQEAPQVSMAADGRFVITWQGIHSGAQDKTGYGVYARAFTFNGSSIAIGGTTSDVLVNQTTKGDQRMPSVAISGNGNALVFSWAGYDQESNNVDPITRVQRHDFGIVARYFVLNATGTGYVDPVTSNNPVTPSAANYKSGEFVVNRIVAGNQVTPMVGMDWDGDFSVTWVTWGTVVNKPVVGETLGESAPQMYERAFRPNGVGTMPVVQTTGILGTSKSSSSSSSVRSSGGGYQVTTSQAMVVLPYTIKGTSGNDVFEVIPGTVSGSWVIKLNGVIQNIPAGTPQIVFDGVGGKNTIRITGTDAADVATFDAGSQVLSWDAKGLSLTASKFGVLSLDGQGGEDTLKVVTSQLADTVSLEVNDFALDSNAMKASAVNFENVMVTSGGGRDVAVLSDSGKNAQLKMATSRTTLEGMGFYYEVNGFSTISAFSTSGKSSAVLTGSSYADTLIADEYRVALNTGSIWNQANGFNAVTVLGQGSGNVAQIKGSERGGDYYYATKSVAELDYSSGQTLTFSGFQKVNVDVHYGSQAVIEGGMGFKGYDDYALWTGTGFNQTLSGFNSLSVKSTKGLEMKAYLELSAQADVSLRGSGNTVSVNVDGLDLYHLIAFDQVNAKKSVGGKTGTVENTTDYLFTTGAWE
ncbi:MAG: hypothetical protein ACRC10_06085 [Thermoguttaceae bacterium]